MKLDRRFLLRGTCQGALAVVGMPFLDCFLDNKGKAMAATGRPLPTRLGHLFLRPWPDQAAVDPQEWRQGLGHDHPVSSRSKAPAQQDQCLVSPQGTAGRQSQLSALVGRRGPAATGISPTKQGEFDSKSIDQQIAKLHRPRRPLQVGGGGAAAGDPASRAIPAWARPTLCRRKPRRLSLYTRLFGPGFQDPSKGDWKPDPQVMIQQSVLSVVSDDRKRAKQNLSAAVKARMDKYFTSVLEAELQMAAQLQRPEIQAKVTIPEAPGEMTVNNALPNLRKTVPLMARLGALAMATDQTRVFNFSVSEPGSQIFVPGDTLGYHQSTHEEPIDPVLAYQPRVSQYNIDNMELFATYLKEMDSIPEGDGTLLDHSLFFAFTDQSVAKIHAVDGLPIFTAGGSVRPDEDRLSTPRRRQRRQPRRPDHPEGHGRVAQKPGASGLDGNQRARTPNCLREGGLTNFPFF